jgi:oxygen-dependent protoporphyrinogen oxidase
MEHHSPDVVVVGAGISGLCVAHWLKKAGMQVLVLERDPDVGGTMKTIAEHGFLVETGPNSALETTPLIHELVRDLNLQHEFLYAHPAGRNRFILKHGTLHALPLNPIAFLTTPLFSLPAKLRVLQEPFIGRAEQEESIAEFVVRRLGQEFLDYAIDPFVAGVFAAKPDRLSVRVAFPKLYALEERYGGLLKGMVRGRKERRARAEKAKDRARTFSFLHGMQTLPRSLAQQFGSSVRCNATVTAIHNTNRERSGQSEHHPLYTVEFLQNGAAQVVRAKTVVLATPAYAAAPLLRPISQATAQVLASIPYAPVASIFLGFPREAVPHPLNGFGFLVPSVEHRKILGCLWSSSLFPRRAPEGFVGLTVFIGGSRQPEFVERDEEQLVQIALEELKSIMQITGKAVYWKATRWQRAIPQYEIGYGRTLAQLDEFEQHHDGLLLCSNYRGGISVSDCLQSARRIAERILERTGQPTAPSSRVTSFTT